MEILVFKSIKISLAYAKHFGIECLFGIWFKLMELYFYFLPCDWKDAICEDLRFEYLADGY